MIYVNLGKYGPYTTLFIYYAVHFVLHLYKFNSLHFSFFTFHLHTWVCFISIKCNSNLLLFIISCHYTNLLTKKDNVLFLLCLIHNYILHRVLWPWTTYILYCRKWWYWKKRSKLTNTLFQFCVSKGLKKLGIGT